MYGRNGYLYEISILKKHAYVKLLLTIFQILHVLQKLHLHNCAKIIGNGFVNFSNLMLKDLDISRCPNLTDEGLLHLHNLHTLQKLNLHHCKTITDGALIYIKMLKNLILATI